MRDIKKEQAITLIALVVTLVILIILAAVSINMVLGDQGILKKAQEGANAMYEAEVNTQVSFNSITDEIDKIIDTKEVEEIKDTTYELLTEEDIENYFLMEEYEDEKEHKKE